MVLTIVGLNDGPKCCSTFTVVAMKIRQRKKFRVKGMWGILGTHMGYQKTSKAKRIRERF